MPSSSRKAKGSTANTRPSRFKQGHRPWSRREQTASEETDVSYLQVDPDAPPWRLPQTLVNTKEVVRTLLERTLQIDFSASFDIPRDSAVASRIQAAMTRPGGLDEIDPRDFSLTNHLTIFSHFLHTTDPEQEAQLRRFLVERSGSHFERELNRLALDLERAQSKLMEAYTYSTVLDNELKLQIQHGEAADSMAVKQRLYMLKTVFGRTDKLWNRKSTKPLRSIISVHRQTSRILLCTVFFMAGWLSAMTLVFSTPVRTGTIFASVMSGGGHFRHAAAFGFQTEIYRGVL